ncbi:hypothetical protein ES319_D13G095700v1, partial [Gossypium barbadense]
LGLTPRVNHGRKGSLKKNCHFDILSSIPLVPRALCSRSDHIDIPSTQHRSSKGSRRLTKSRKPRSFQKMDSYSKSA